MRNRVIDLYSDTKTKPSAGMRKAMAEAEVGDEQKFEDPTVETLRQKVCALLGKEDAVFLPSGTMCNQIAIRVHCAPGDEIICHRSSHIINSEAGGTSANSGVMIRPIDTPDGTFTAEEAEACVRDAGNRYQPRSKLIEIEQTANLVGGKIWPLETLEAIGAMAKRRNLKMHMDGARLMNAVVATGIPAAKYSAPFDSVWIDFTKGLGAPVGAMLAGPKDFIKEAWRWKQGMGGSMRQSGIVAAGALYALENNVKRLADDHENAQHLAKGLSQIDGLKLAPADYPTNIVFFEIEKNGWTAPKLAAALKAKGVEIGAFGAQRVRVLTHLDVSRADIDTALGTIRDTLAGAPPA